MATKALEGLGKLEDQLTCPICLDHFDNPKILPCFHSFCMGCLECIKTHNGPEGLREIRCPTCRLPCSVPDKGLTMLPASFVINNLIEVYSLMKKVSGGSHASCDNCGDHVADRYCKQCAKFFCLQCLHHHNNWKPNTNHETITLEEVASTAYQLPTARPEITEQCADHNKPLEIFCETCQELICHNCTVKKHRNHDYDVASDVYSKHRNDIIESSLQPLNSEVDRIAQAMKLLETQRDDVTDQAKKTKEEIQRKIQTRLEEMSEKLKEEVDTALKYTVSMLDGQIKDAKASLGRMTECRDHVEQCVRVGTPRQVLTTKAQMIERAKNILKEVKDKTFEPLEEADIKLIQGDVMDTFDANIGRVASGNHNSPLKSSLPSNQSKQSSFPLVSDQPINNSAPTHSPMIGHDSVVTVSLKFPDGSPVPSSLIECTSTVSGNSGRPIPCPLVDGSRLGLYNIVFTPLAKGNHQLQFRVNIPVSVATEITTAPICPPNAKLNGPSGIAFTDQGLVVVCESYGSSIKVIDNQGGVVKSFSSKGTKRGELQRPQGLVVTARGTVLVADWYNHRIQEFTLEGVCKACIGTKGNDKLQFCYPVGMAVSKKTGQIFVAELGNSRIQVLNSNLTFSHMFGSKGKEQWQFQELHDVAIDPDGLFVYATDRLSNCVKKFSTDGNFVASFNTEDSEEGEMFKPSGITVANDLLFVNNEDRYITVLTTTGEHFGFIDKSAKEVITNSGFLQGIACKADTKSLYFYCVFDKAVKFCHYVDN